MGITIYISQETEFLRLFYLCVSVFCLHVYMCTMFVVGAYRSQKRSLEPLDLETTWITMWVLRTSGLKHWDISSALGSRILWGAFSRPFGKTVSCKMYDALTELQSSDQDRRKYTWASVYCAAASFHRGRLDIFRKVKQHYVLSVSWGTVKSPNRTTLWVEWKVYWRSNRPGCLQEGREKQHGGKQVDLIGQSAGGVSGQTQAV